MRPKYQPIRVSVSASFPVRSRCGRCGNKYFHYWENLPFYCHEPRTAFLVAEWYKSFIKHINNDWYLSHQPREFHLVNDTFSFEYPGRAYKPKLHHTRGVDTTRHKVDIISCDCGACVWLFAQTTTEDRVEIVNRKGKYGYPRKYSF